MHTTVVGGCCLEIESFIFHPTLSYLWHSKADWKNYSLLFNERCSCSPCRQQCVTVTGWCHLASPILADIRLSARICSPVLLPWHSKTGKWTWGPHNEPSSRLWITRRLHLIQVPQLVLFWCVGHSVFTPGDESEHHVELFVARAITTVP